MVKIYDEKARNGIRLYIQNSDLEEWGLENVNDETVKRWVKEGQSKESLNERLDQIEDKLDRFIQMVGFFTHQTFRATVSLQDEIDREIERCRTQDGSFNETPFLQLINKRYAQSYLTRKKFFPEFYIPGKLKDIEELEKEREEYHKSRNINSSNHSSTNTSKEH